MRLAFLILLLVNLALLFWSQGYLGTPERKGEAARLAQQIAPERLRVVPAAPARPPAPVAETDEKTIQ